MRIVGGGANEKRIAVRRRFGDVLGGDAGNGVGIAAGSEGHDQFDRAIGLGLSQRSARRNQGEQRDQPRQPNDLLHDAPFKRRNKATASGRV